VAGTISGLILDVVIAGRYGLAGETDAFFLAFATPFVLRSVLDGSVRATVVPVLAQLGDGSEQEGVRTAQRDRVEATAIMGIFGVCVAVAAVLALTQPLWLGVVAFAVDESSLPLVRQLTTLFLVWFALSGCSVALRGALLARHRFFLPGFDRAVDHAGAIAGGLFLASRFGILGVAYGYVAGAALYLVVALAEALRSGINLMVRPRFGDPTVRSMAKGALTIGAVSAGRRGSVIIERALASGLPTGSVSALTFATRMVNAMCAVTTGALITGVLPSLSAAARTADPRRWGEYLQTALLSVGAVALPLAVVVALVGPEMAQVLFQRGAATAEGIAELGRLLLFFVPYLIAGPLEQALLIGLFAKREVAKASRLHLAMTIVYPLLALGLVRFGAPGLATAFVLTYVLSVIWLLASSRREGWVDLAVLARRAGPFLAAAAVAFALGGLVIWSGPASRLPALAVIVAAGGAASLAYVAAGMLGPGRPLWRLKTDWSLGARVHAE